MGVARQTISKWELGETAPDLTQAKMLSQIFNVSLDDIFSDFLDINANKSIHYSLAGFDTLEDEDKETIEHLITYFNRNKLN